MKILITGGKSASSLKLVKAFSNDQVVLADYGEMPSFPSSEYQFASLGERNDDTIAHNLLNHCLNESVGAVLPIHMFEIEAVAKSSVLFEEFDIKVLLPKITQLSEYLDAAARSKDWAVYFDGKLLFASNPSASYEKLGQEGHLNGAFYLSEHDNSLKANLLTIS